MNSWMLSLIIDSFRTSLCGRRVAECRLFERIFLMEFMPSDGSGEKTRPEFLTALLSDSDSFIFLSNEDVLASCPFTPVFTALKGALLTSLSQPKGDRTVLLTFERKNKTNLILRIALYGRRVRAQIESSGKVIDALFSRSSGPAPDARPEKAGFADINEQDLRSLLASGEKCPGLDKKLIDFFTPETGKTDLSNLIVFRDTVRKGNASFNVIHADKPAAASPFPYEKKPQAGRRSIEAAAGSFTDPCSAALSIGINAVGRRIKKIIDKRISPFRGRLEARKKLLLYLDSELKTAADHEKFKRRADVLAAYQAGIKPGLKNVDLPDPYQNGQIIRFDLEPAKSIQEQVRRLYAKAAKLKRGLRFISERRQKVLDDIKNLESMLNDVAGAGHPGEAIAIIDSFAPPSRLRFNKPSSAREAKRSRRFDIDATWYVLVGRNNKENDELTFKTASPSDIWMHAQQAAGSHVILKSSRSYVNPPRYILEAAARVAAFYSKARNSSLVPVIYTLRKYVRKPRKAPPGLVVCSREKTLFVEPQLPEERL